MFDKGDVTRLQKYEQSTTMLQDMYAIQEEKPLTVISVGEVDNLLDALRRLTEYNTWKVLKGE